VGGAMVAQKAPSTSTSTSPSTSTVASTSTSTVPSTSTSTSTVKPATTTVNPATTTTTAVKPGGAEGCTATITVVPTDSHVQWGTVDLGVGPAAGVSVPCGEAQVSITHPRYANVMRAANASKEAPATMDVKMQRPPAVLTLRSIPPGATITIDRAGVGRAPVTAKVQGFETLHVTATLPGYAPWHRHRSRSAAPPARCSRGSRA